MFCCYALANLVELEENEKRSYKPNFSLMTVFCAVFNELFTAILYIRKVPELHWKQPGLTSLYFRLFCK